MKKIILLAFPITILTFQHPSHAATEAARVNDKVITVEQVSQRLNDQIRSGASSAITKKEILDDLVKREVAVQEAKKMKLDQDPVIAERINNVLYFALLEKKLGTDFEKITLSDAEAKNWYEKNPEIRTSHIFVLLPNGSSNEDEKKASLKLNAILADIRSGKISFAEAAQKFSEDPSSAMGGDLDYRMKDRLDPSYYRAALKLGKAGEMSGVVKTPFGLHVIRLTGKHNWSEVDRQKVKRMIFEERKQELITNYLDELRQKAKVSINSGAIKD